MNAERLLAHYERIADAPDAIVRLRRFVLDLAVRGKLVPQDVNDEPASDLLKRIEIEKTRLLNGSKIRRQPALTAVTGAEVPHELPTAWAWVRVGEIFDYDAGRKCDPKQLDQSRWLLELEDIERDTSRVVQRLRVTDRDSQSTKSEFNPGDILYGKLRPYLNKVIVADEPGYSTTEIVAIRPFYSICSEYCALAFRRPDFVNYVERLGRGTKMPRLRTPDAITAPFPLPPLSEQHRIVAKVDELMRLCDRLEMASLARLTAPDSEAFRVDACFTLHALPALTARADQIKALRQNILNFAVRGNLARQNAQDEPVFNTIADAIARRTATFKPKKARTKNVTSEIGLDLEIDLPSGWSLERLGNLVDPENTISYGVLVPGEEVPDGIPFVRAQDLTLDNHPERPNKTIASEVERAYARTRLRGGEILVCVVGSIGKLGVVPQSWAGANIARAVARIFPIAEISQEYLLIVLRGEPVQSYFKEATRTLAQPTLNIGLIEQTPIPVPPLAEQHRIVAKVDALMSLCDRLEAALAAADSARARLLDALLAEALDGADVPRLAAAE